MKILFCTVTCSFTVRANTEKKILQILHHLIQDEETPLGCLQRPSVISSFDHKKQKGSVREDKHFFLRAPILPSGYLISLDCSDWLASETQNATSKSVLRDCDCSQWQQKVMRSSTDINLSVLFSLRVRDRKVSRILQLKLLVMIHQLESKNGVTSTVTGCGFQEGS